MILIRALNQVVKHLVKYSLHTVFYLAKSGRNQLN